MTPEGIFMSSTVSPHAQSRGRRRILGFLTAALLIFGLGSASFADGGAPTLRVTLTPNAQTVKTGDNVVYTVEFSCASTDANCDGAVLTVDVPRFANPDGAVNSEVAPVLAAATSTTGVVAPPTIVAPTRNSDGKVVYNLGTVPAGTAGQATITVRPPRGLVPKGATIAPEASFAASSATRVNAKTSTTVDGSADLSILKSGPVVPPVKGVEVTYTLRASYAAAMDATGKYTGVPAVGHVNADDVVVTDRLPACAQYVRSSLSGNLQATAKTPSGSYDAASHSVVWDMGNAAEAFDSTFSVTVRYPASCADAKVTNNAEITGKMHGNHAIALRDGADFSHGFGAESAKGSFQKFTPVNVLDRGTKATWGYRMRNAGNVPLHFSGTDVLPCRLATPSDGETGCAVPAIKNVGVRDVNNVGFTVKYTTNLGNTGTFVANATEQTPVSSETEWIVKLEFTGALPGGANVQMFVTGTVNSELPRTEDGAGYEQAALSDGNYKAGASQDWVRVQNCLAPGSKYTTDSGREIAFSRDASCAWIRVANERPLLNLRKLVFSGSPQAPNGNVTFRMDVANYSTNSPVSPVVTDLLPCGMTYVEGSAAMRNTTSIPASSLKVDSGTWKTDAAGCKRQLVKFSFPGTELSNGQWGWFVFEGKVGQMKAGRYPNDAQISPAGKERTMGELTYCNSTMGSPVADSQDLNGNGRTDDMLCQSSANFDVINASSMSVTKEVKGSKDADFLAAPSVGLVEPGKSAQYRLTVTNTGNVDLDNVVVYDVLPHVGDRGVGPAVSNARGSQWQPRLAGPVAVADSDVQRDRVKIQYSTSENACRGEVTAQGAARAAGPAGCVDDWTDSPASFADVRAVRAEFANANLAPKASIQMIVPVAAPTDASGTAWNSVAMAGREKGGKWLLPIEPIKVGLETTVDLEVEKAIAERKPAYGVGDEVDFHVTVKNLGSGEATSVKVRDLLPEGLEYVSSETRLCPNAGGKACTSGEAVGSYDAATGLWTLFPDGQAARSLSAGASATLVVRAKIAPGAAGKKLTNAASLESLDQKDDNAANDSSKASLDVLQSVSGSVYRDSDRDGARGGGEAGVEGTKVELRDRDGAVVATATTGADGSYSFNRVPSGTYEVVVVADGGELAKAVATGDPDSTKDGRASVSVDPGAPSVSGLDFGYYRPASVGDRVWYDLDGNGVQGADEPGAEGVKVTLVDASGQPARDVLGAEVTPVTTDAKGRYSFEKLAAGSYTVKFEVPGGTAAAATGAGGDPSADSNGPDAAVTLAEGESNGSIDLGLVGEGSVGSLVWLDSNQNGAADPGEPGIPGVAVTVTWAGPDGKFGTDDDRRHSVTTDANGEYRVDRLFPGEYSVALGDVAGPSAAVGDGAAVSLQTFEPERGALTGDKTIDVSSGGTFILKSRLTLAPGEMENLRHNFGFAVPIDLSLTKKVVGESARKSGDEVVYRLEAANRGPGTATGVKVEDRLPKGLTFVSADRPYDSATGLWDVGTLAPGKSAEISIVARATGEGDLVNSAEIAAADQKDVDSTPGNGVASEDDAASATVTVKPAPKPTPSPSPTPSAEPTSPTPTSPTATPTQPTPTSPTPTPTSSPTPSTSSPATPSPTTSSPTPSASSSSTGPVSPSPASPSAASPSAASPSAVSPGPTASDQTNGPAPSADSADPRRDGSNRDGANHGGSNRGGSNRGGSNRGGEAPGDGRNGAEGPLTATPRKAPLARAGASVGHQVAAAAILTVIGVLIVVARRRKGR